MNPRLLIVVAVLIALFCTLTHAGTKRPGARPPVGPPPGAVPVGHAHNDIRYHLDQQTKHLEQLLKQDNSLAPSGASGSVPKSATGVVPGSKPAIRSSTPTAPHHLIGDPPLPGSVRDLYDLNTSSGVPRRPGARPNAPPTTRSAPHHLIGDPPTYPDDLGVPIGSAYFLSDDRAVLSGEVNLYTGPLTTVMYQGQPVYWQTVFNWNPTTGIGRMVFWRSIAYYCPNDPSWVSYYYYAPSSVAPTPAPTPTTPPPILRYSTGASDPHIYLASAPAGTSTGWISGQAVSGAFGPVGQSTVQMAPGSSYVAYYSGSEHPVFAGGQITTASRFSPEDFTDDAYPLATESGSSPRGLSVGLPDCSPGSGTIVEAIVGVEAASSGRAFVESPSAIETLSAQGEAQAFRALPGGYLEKTAPPVEEGSNSESGDVSVAQTSSSSTIQGSGSAWPWAVGGLLLGAGLLVGTRKVMTWNQEAPLITDPEEIEGSISQQVEKIYSGLVSDIRQEKAREQHQLAVENYQQRIDADRETLEYETQESQRQAQQLRQDTEALPQVTQKLQQDTQKMLQAKEVHEQDWENYQEVANDPLFKEAAELQAEKERLQWKLGELLPPDIDPIDLDYIHYLVETGVVPAPLWMEDPDEARAEASEVEAELEEVEEELDALDEELEPLEDELQDLSNALEDDGQEYAIDSIEVGQDELAASSLNSEIENLQENQTDLAADIAEKQADLDDAEKNLAAARNYNESDYSGSDHGLDDFVNNFLDLFDPDQYGLGGFDETASLPFIAPAPAEDNGESWAGYIDTVQPSLWDAFPQGLPLQGPPSLGTLLEWARQLADRLMPPMFVDPTKLQGGQQLANAVQKFAQDYAPLLDVLLGCSGLGRETRGPTTQFDKSGGLDQANKDFDSLNLRNVVDRGDGVRTGQLPDGRTVAVYPESSGGPPTLEIQSGDERGKIRYGQ